jgi:hypothetical protein
VVRFASEMTDNERAVLAPPVPAIRPGPRGGRPSTHSVTSPTTAVLGGPVGPVPARKTVVAVLGGRHGRPVLLMVQGWGGPGKRDGAGR